MKQEKALWSGVVLGWIVLLIIDTLFGGLKQAYGWKRNGVVKVALRSVGALKTIAVFTLIAANALLLLRTQRRLPN
jgi:hypothetical protein